MNAETPTKRKLGRPTLPPEKARGIFEKLRVNQAERNAIQRAAKRAKKEKSEWMRETLLSAAA